MSERVINSARLPAWSYKATPEPKDLAEKFAAKIAAKKVEEERIRKTIKQIKKRISATVIPSLYEIKGAFPNGIFQLKRQYNASDDEAVGVYFWLSGGPIIAILSDAGKIAVKMLKLRQNGEASELLLTDIKQQQISSPEELTREKILSLVELAIDHI